MQYKVLCIGDSHTAGFPGFDPMFGGDPYSSYQYWLKKECESEILELDLILDNQGICGQTSWQIVSRLQHILNSKQMEYQTIILWAGANDVGIGYEASDIYNNIFQGITLAKELDLSILALTIPPMDWPGANETVSEFNQMLKANSSNQYHILDVYDSLVHNNKLDIKYDSGDGIHLSIEGYTKVASTIKPALIHLIQKHFE